MTQTEIKVLKLEKEMELLRSFVIGFAGKDAEGKYRASFIKKILKGLSALPKFQFKDAPSFLSQISKVNG